MTEMPYKLIFLICITFGCLVSCYMNWSLLNQRKELQNTIKAYQESIIELKESIQKQAEVLYEREKKIDKLSNDKYKLNQRLQEAISNEKEVREWAATLVPPSVDSLLKSKNGDNDSSASSGSM